MLVAHAAAEGIVIHLAPPVLGNFLGMPITATLMTTWVVMGLVVVGIFVLRRKLAMVPGKAQLISELLIGGVYEYMQNVLQDEALTKRWFPLIMTVFLFVLLINWFGLLPGVGAFGFYGESHGETALIPLLYPAHTDLNMTIALSIIAFVAIEVAGVLAIGFFKYTGKFINFRSLLGFFIGLIELFSEMARLISFSFRLFGNIFAGKTLLLIAMFFVPFVLPVPILAFELFVGLIQAFIFAVLMLFFIKLAVEEPH